MTFDELRSFAIGELGWTLERYLKSTVYEFNEAALGYWRHRDRTVLWATREIVWELIRGNPHYKDRPRSKREMMSLAMDEKLEVDSGAYTDEDMKIFEQIQYKKNQDGTDK